MKQSAPICLPDLSTLPFLLTVEREMPITPGVVFCHLMPFAPVPEIAGHCARLRATIHED